MFLHVFVCSLLLPSMLKSSALRVEVKTSYNTIHYLKKGGRYYLTIAAASLHLQISFYTSGNRYPKISY